MKNHALCWISHLIHKTPLLDNNKYPTLLQICVSTVGQFSQIGDDSSKRGGGYFCCLPIFLCVLDAKFNVDYDFAIKHDLIL